MALLIKLLFMALATLTASQLVTVLTNYLNSWISQHIVFDMKNQMYAHLQKMSHAFFTSEHQGDIITRMNTDVSGVSTVISSTLSSILSNVATVVTTLIALFGMNVKMAIVGILRFLSVILTPINCIFMLWKKLLTKIFKAKAVDTVTEGELLTLVDEAHEDGSIDEYNKELIENIFDFDDLSAGEIATHRTELTILDLSDDMDKWDHTIINSRYSRYPICGDSIDDIIGILDARNYLRLEDKSRENVMATVVSPAYFVPEAVKADVLFKNMREHKESLAVVLDEYGGLYGIVTMTDLVECLVGEFTQPDDDEEEIESIEVLEDGSWRIAGSASISEVEEAIGIKFEDIDSDTFSGFVLGLYGSVPEDGASFELSTDTLDIHIEDIKDHKIDRAVITLRASDSEEDKDSKEEKEKKDKDKDKDSDTEE
jgi:putative hemolysin